MVRTMIQLTEEQAKALKKIARARKMSVSAIVRESVAMYVRTERLNAQREEKRLRALEGLEKIKRAKYRDIEGKTDVSVNHDKYLEEIYAS